MPRSPLAAVALGALVCALLCAGLGTLTALPSAVGLMHAIGAGHYGAMPPFEQGQLVGRVLGGPCSGLLCGALGGALVGWALHKVTGGPAASG